jgi:hypothetical protein
MSQTGQAYVEDFLAHYASEFYDPAKAHEYYIKNRELKNRQSTSELTVTYQTQAKSKAKTSKNKFSRKSKKPPRMVTKVNEAATARRKEAWAYAKNQIGEARKADLKDLSADRKAVADKARRTAKAKREEISKSMEALMLLLTSKKKGDSEQLDADEKSALERLAEQRAEKTRKIRDKASSEIDAIPLVPDGVRGAQRERLVEARAKKIARINGEATKDISAVTSETATQREAISADFDAKRKTLSEDVTEQRSSERESATADRKRIATQLKATVTKAKADYEAGKERLIAAYEVRQQEEFDAIKARVH